MNQNQMQQLQRARAQEVHRQRLIQQEQYRRQLAQRQRPQVQRQSGKSKVVSGLGTAVTGYIVGNAIHDAYKPDIEEMSYAGEITSFLTDLLI